METGRFLFMFDSPKGWLGDVCGSLSQLQGFRVPPIRHLIITKKPPEGGFVFNGLHVGRQARLFRLLIPISRLQQTWLGYLLCRHQSLIRLILGYHQHLRLRSQSLPSHNLQFFTNQPTINNRLHFNPQIAFHCCNWLSRVK